MERVCALYFSATGTTRKVVMTVAETLAETLGVPLQELPFSQQIGRASCRERVCEAV